MSKTLAQLPNNSLMFPTTRLSNTVIVLKTFRSGLRGALYNSNIGVTLTVTRSEKIIFKQLSSERKHAAAKITAFVEYDKRSGIEKTAENELNYWLIHSPFPSLCARPSLSLPGACATHNIFITRQSGNKDRGRFQFNQMFKQEVMPIIYLTNQHEITNIKNKHIQMLYLQLRSHLVHCQNLHRLRQYLIRPIHLLSVSCDVSLGLFRRHQMPSFLLVAS